MGRQGSNATFRVCAVDHTIFDMSAQNSGGAPHVDRLTRAGRGSRGLPNSRSQRTTWAGFRNCKAVNTSKILWHACAITCLAAMPPWCRHDRRHTYLTTLPGTPAGRAETRTHDQHHASMIADFSP